jgi:hypothetical protein
VTKNQAATMVLILRIIISPHAPKNPRIKHSPPDHTRPCDQESSSHHTTKNQADTTQPRINQTPSHNQESSSSHETKNQAATTQPRIKPPQESKCKQTNGNQIDKQIDKQMQASKQASKFMSKCISKQMHKQTNIYIKCISKQTSKMISKWQMS